MVYFIQVSYYEKAIIGCDHNLKDVNLWLPTSAKYKAHELRAKTHHVAERFLSTQKIRGSLSTTFVVIRLHRVTE